MKTYLITSSRWEGGDIRQRATYTITVEADSFDVDQIHSLVARFYDQDEVLIAVYTNFESIVLVTE